MTGVLRGVRVIETASFVSGPYVGQLLGDLGADVVKVENPRGGDPFRGANAYELGFQAYNPNKRSVAIDLTEDAGADLIRRMASQADILVENYRPGVMEKRGLGWDVLRKLNPRLIYCSLTGFGHDGPYRNRPAFDSVVSALSGFFDQTMLPDRPQILGPAVSDAITGLYGVYGILGALHERGRTGQGCRVDVTMIESMVAFLRQCFVLYFDRGESPDPLARPAQSTAFALQCADGKLIAIHLSVPEKFWTALLGAAERPDLRDDPRFTSRAGRIKNFRELTETLRPTFRLRSRMEWMARLEQSDIPFAPINNLKDVHDDPQLRHLGTFTTFLHPVHGERGTVNRPVFYDGKRANTVNAPPALGEHTDEILAEFGIADSERALLRARGIIG